MLDEHGDDWTAQLDDRLTAANTAYDRAVSALAAAHHERIAAHRARKLLGSELPPMGGVIRLKPRQLDGIEVLY